MSPDPAATAPRTAPRAAASSAAAATAPTTAPASVPAPAPAPAPIAALDRGGVVESRHLGHVVVVGPDGATTAAAGDPDAEVFGRSSLKPLQLVGMLRAGLPVTDPELLALAAASHNGEPGHLDGVRRLLAGAGVGEEALANTPDLPLLASASRAWLAAGREASSLTQNCSGKHAAMLATCVANGWPTAGYLDPEHPLQRAVMAAVTDLAGAEPSLVTTDGCGTPLPLLPLSGLARAFSRMATAAPGSPERRVADAMGAHPWMVAGTGRDVTAFVEGVPGMFAKDGAEGVFAFALADGRAAAFKTVDGSTRPYPVVVSALLTHLGVEAPVVAERASVPVLGHGRPVGALVSTPGLESVQPAGPAGPSGRTGGATAGVEVGGAS